MTVTLLLAITPWPVYVGFIGTLGLVVWILAMLPRAVMALPEALRARRRFASAAVVTAVAFWIPDSIVHAARGNEFSGRDVTLLTGLLPAIVFLMVWIAWKRGPLLDDSVGMIGAALGVWFFGPLLILLSGYVQANVNGTPAYGLFKTIGAIAVMTALFPLFTFSLSGYDGTLLALLIVTAGLLTLSWVVDRRRRASAADAARGIR